MKKRFVIFAVLTVISAVFTITFSLGGCGLTAVQTDFVNDVDNSNNMVDGTDFTPVFKTGAFFLDLFMNEILPVLMLIVFFIVTTLLNLALFGFYRLFGLRGELEAGTEELRLTRKFYIISALALTAITVIITLCGVAFGGSSAYCFFDLLLCWQYPLFAWLFCLRRLKKCVTE